MWILLLILIIIIYLFIPKSSFWKNQPVYYENMKPYQIVNKIPLPLKIPSEVTLIKNYNNLNEILHFINNHYYEKFKVPSKLIYEKIKNSTTFSLHYNNTIVGFICCININFNNLNFGYVDYLCIHKKYRRKGYANILISHTSNFTNNNIFIHSKENSTLPYKPFYTTQFYYLRKKYFSNIKYNFKIITENNYKEAFDIFNKLNENDLKINYSEDQFKYYFIQNENKISLYNEEGIISGQIYYINNEIIYEIFCIKGNVLNQVISYINNNYKIDYIICQENQEMNNDWKKGSFMNYYSYNINIPKLNKFSLDFP